MLDNLPLLPTTVMGSHGIPSWLWTALEEIKAGRYGRTDAEEAFDDATRVAIQDQLDAGIDVLCDGEMRRWFFVQSFYKRMTGLQPAEPLRQVGLYGYDSAPRYRPVERITVPHGLGIVGEFAYLKSRVAGPVKATCPDPLTLSIHIQLRPGDPYKDRLELAWEFAPW